MAVIMRTSFTTRILVALAATLVLYANLCSSHRTSYVLEYGFPLPWGTETVVHMRGLTDADGIPVPSGTSIWTVSWSGLLVDVVVGGSLLLALALATELLVRRRGGDDFAEPWSPGDMPAEQPHSPGGN